MELTLFLFANGISILETLLALLIQLQQMCPRCAVASRIDKMRRQLLIRALALRELHEYFGAASALHDLLAETTLRTGYGDKL